ncbi:hypothetical protein IFM89_010795 [Coptis chinensis]|uniref:Protein FAR1-RELATED SEQUENCE n=1 Tax=Coptis chinensis TaxID=261450 RepID=A0A835ILV5_9MAGN|nr:hypothetical protein IFM89_010795 [Coptis chinensis]
MEQPHQNGDSPKISCDVVEDYCNSSNEKDMLEFVTENQEDYGLIEGDEHLQWENIVGANYDNVESVENGSEGVEMDEDNEDMLNGIQPCVGMEFDSPEEAYDFYNYFARRTRFSVRKYVISKSQRNNEIIARSYYCSLQDFCNATRSKPIEQR